MQAPDIQGFYCATSIFSFWGHRMKIGLAAADQCDHLQRFLRPPPGSNFRNVILQHTIFRQLAAISFLKEPGAPFYDGDACAKLQASADEEAEALAVLSTARGMRTASSTTAGRATAAHAALGSMTQSGRQSRSWAGSTKNH